MSATGSTSVMPYGVWASAFGQQVERRRAAAGPAPARRRSCSSRTARQRLRAAPGRGHRPWRRRCASDAGEAKTSVASTARTASASRRRVERARRGDVHVGHGRGDAHGGAVERERRERGDEPVVGGDGVEVEQGVAVAPRPGGAGRRHPWPGPVAPEVNTTAASSSGPGPSGRSRSAAAAPRARPSVGLDAEQPRRARRHRPGGEPSARRSAGPAPRARPRSTADRGAAGHAPRRRACQPAGTEPGVGDDDRPRRSASTRRRRRSGRRRAARAGRRARRVGRRRRAARRPGRRRRRRAAAQVIDRPATELGDGDLVGASPGRRRALERRPMRAPVGRRRAVARLLRRGTPSRCDPPRTSPKQRRGVLGDRWDAPS